jgi:hypothetical protein
MSVPLNCEELCLDGKSPRFLRGGALVACLRSTRGISLEQQLEASTRRLFGDPHRPLHRGLLCDLEDGVALLPST